MTKIELLDTIVSLLGSIADAVDLAQNQNDKDDLNELRDTLNEARNKLSQLIINEQDKNYIQLTDQLGAVNSKIKELLTELAKLAVIIDGIKQAVDIVIEIAKLAKGV